jgi:hypothetical protein
LAHLSGYPGIVGPNAHREAINPKPDGLVVIDNLPIHVSILTYMLIFDKRFFLSGLAILLSLDSVGRALPAINNLKKRWAVPTLRKKRKKLVAQASSLWPFTGWRPVPLIRRLRPVPRPEAHRLNPPVSPFFIFAKAAFLSYSRR